MSSYDASFYARIGAAARSSAQVIVPKLMEALQPQAVVDVGCGTGAFLSVFREHGVKEVLGLDGGHIDLAQLDIPREAFKPVDLANPPRLSRRFDLAMCLEVAEHLPASESPRLVEFLCELSPAVFFSAAVPFQGGTEHVNEQWPKFWSDLFNRHGYKAIDSVRPAVWQDERVAPWYAQNAVLFVHQDRLSTYPGSSKWVASDTYPALIHPALWTAKMSQLSRGSVRGGIAMAVRGIKRLLPGS